METFPEPPCQFKGEDIVSTCFNYGCSAGQHHLPIHHPPGLVPLKHLLPCRFPRCLPNPRMATTRHCRKKAVAVWPQADGTSDTSVLCPWWWMVTVHMGVILCLIFGLVMIGLMEMNEQYDVSIISQSNWQFWGQPDLAIGCIPPSAGFRLRMEPCHARQDGKLPGKICVQRLWCIEPCNPAAIPGHLLL